MTRKNRQTQTLITVEPSDHEGLWTCICEAHDRCCDFDTKQQATYFAASPADWCQECYEVWEQKGKPR